MRRKLDKAAEHWLKHLAQDRKSARCLKDASNRRSNLRVMFGIMRMADVTPDQARWEIQKT